MAVLEVIRNFFVPAGSRDVAVIHPAQATSYSIHPLFERDLDEVLRLNLRCFKDGENYTKHTFKYLLTQPNALCYQVVTAEDKMAGFVCILVGEDGTGHITTIAVAPEHRRRGLAERLLGHLDRALIERGVSSVVLEVRVSNTVAQQVYLNSGYTVVQQLPRYYNNGEDGLLMVKSLHTLASPAAA
ncbi:MAG TPA: ribosomal protein S18-alanine N-acetyltransferase [Pyrinomonadaceae bacterium]|nr:ribosomal protein S18-alanine N-acetyltransferase [Pyrinomonadaceae bacterium]